MRLEALIHIGRVALEMLGPEGEIVVVGSSSLLASYPELGKEGAILGSSYDADIIPFPFSEDVGIMIHEAMGEDRRFHLINGYCADVLRPKISEQFASGWRNRLIPLGEIERVLCLDPHDLAAAKCRVGRKKDIELVSFLCQNFGLDLDIVEDRLRMISMPEAEIVKAHQNLNAIRGT